MKRTPEIDSMLKIAQIYASGHLLSRDGQLNPLQETRGTYGRNHQRLKMRFLDEVFDPVSEQQTKYLQSGKLGEKIFEQKLASSYLKQNLMLHYALK